MSLTLIVDSGSRRRHPGLKTATRLSE